MPIAQNIGRREGPMSIDNHEQSSPHN